MSFFLDVVFCYEGVDVVDGEFVVVLELLSGELLEFLDGVGGEDGDGGDIFVEGVVRVDFHFIKFYKGFKVFKGFKDFVVFFVQSVTSCHGLSKKDFKFLISGVWWD